MDNHHRTRAIPARLCRSTQAWIESLLSHVKAEWPHLDRIKDPELLRAQLADVRRQYNSVRLHAAIGYVTPNDEHEGRAPRIRAARKRGLRQARWARIAYHRIEQAKANRRRPSDVDWFAPRSVALTQKHRTTESRESSVEPGNNAFGQSVSRRLACTSRGGGCQSAIVVPTVLITNASGNRVAR